jgi:hypothetical protein
MENFELQYPDELLPVDPAQQENFLALEIQPDELLNDDEIAAQALNDQQPLHGMMDQFPAISLNLNINVGLVRLRSEFVVDGPPLPPTPLQPIKLCADLYRLWAKEFAHAGSPDLVVKIPKIWAPLFLTTLLEPKNFDWAKAFLTSGTCKMLTDQTDEEDIMPFALPSSCPVSETIICEEAGSGEITEEPLATDNPDPANDPVYVVETTFRRSPRIKSRNASFRKPACSSKQCLACSAQAPNLSHSTLKSLGEDICKIPVEKLTEKALKSKARSFKVIGDKANSEKQDKGKMLKKKVNPKKKDVEDEEVDEDADEQHD